MLKIFDANTETAAAEAVIAELLKNNTAGSRHVVITPDRYSLSVERKIFEFSGLAGAMNIDVYSFTNFAKRAVKGLPKCLSKEGTVVLLREVLVKQAETLEYYTNAVHLKTFPKELFAVIASIRNSGIAPETLFETFADGRDAQSKKYRDIARVYGAYEKELNLKFTDTTGRLDALIERAGELKAVTESHFYCIGFLNFYQKQLQILEAILRNAKSLNVAASTSVGGRNDFLFGDKTKRDMYALQKKTGSEIKWYRDDVPVPEPLSYIAKNLFSYRDGQIAPSDRVTLFRENTPYDEVKAAGREIARLVRREGYRYREIAVLLYDDSYKTVVKDIFGRFDLPFFTDTKYDLNAVASVRYFTDALAATADNLKRSAVLRFVKNPLFPMPQPETDAFENYVLKYNADFCRFSEPFAAGDAEERDAAEAVRIKLQDELIAWKETMTAKEAVAAAKAFFSDELLARERALAADADEARRKLHDTGAELLLAQLDEMAELLGDKVVTVKEFRDAAASAIASIEVSLIPMTNDCVFVGTGEESALYGIRALFFLGAAEGVVPKIAGYQAIMPEKDVLIFEKRGIPLYPTPIERLKEERAKLVRLILKAGDRLYVGCPYFNLISDPCEESEFLKELKSVTGYKTERLGARFSEADLSVKENAEDFLISEENALYEYRMRKGSGDRTNAAFFNGLKIRLERDGIDVLRGDRADDTLKPGKAELFLNRKDGEFVTNASQIERYARCPYLHFLEKGLNVRERDVGVAKANDVGSIVHRALEVYFTENKRKLRSMDEKEVAAAANRAIEAAFSEEKAEILKETRFGKILFRTLRNELTKLLPELTDAVKRSAFDPEFIEYRFHRSGDSAVELPTAYGTVYLTGKIDRADTNGEDLILIDYKTGSRVGTLTELYEGRKIQLALYALPLRKKGYRVVGSYYLPLPDGYRVGGRAKSLVGNTLLSPSVTAALDKTYPSDGEWRSEFFPLQNKVGKSRTELAATSGSALLSERQFALLERMAAGSAKNAVEEMIGGSIAKRPTEGVCETCTFSALCLKKSVRKSQNTKWADGVLVRSAVKEEDE